MVIGLRGYFVEVVEGVGGERGRVSDVLPKP
eukprot:gene26525-biopygen16756